MRLLYLLTIATSNILTAKYSPFVLFDGLLIVPVGSVFVGATFLLRDFVQMKHGRRRTYNVIFAAAAISAVMSEALGDTVYVAVASIAAFLASEAIDTEIFSRLNKPLPARLAVSGVIGGLVDSFLFVIIGLSPIGTKMLEWSSVPYAVAGQVTAKVAVQVAAVAIITGVKKNS